jgi:hypothetical protein
MSRLQEFGTIEKLTLVRPMVMPEESTAGDDPLADLLNEFQEYELPETDLTALIVAPPKVALTQKDDQMWLTLGDQLGSLRDGIQRLHFYLSDVDDSVRR